IREFDDGKKKPVLHLEKFDRPFACNITNAGEIAEIANSDDTDDWHGVEIEIAPGKTKYQGKVVDCMRVQRPAAMSGGRTVVREVRAGDVRAASMEPPDDRDIPLPTGDDIIDDGD